MNKFDLSRTLTGANENMPKKDQPAFPDAGREKASLTGPLAIYVHFPFCIKKCAYCDFISYPDMLENCEAYTRALCLEIDRWGEFLEGREIGSVYCGGGTPSLLDTRYFSEMLARLGKRFVMDKKTEITVEVNPGTVDYQKLSELRDAGFNRVSIGIQSNDDSILKVLGRSHCVKQAENTVFAAQEAGFKNINLDLMLGIPGQDRNHWDKTLRWLEGKQFTHLSLYMLHLEENVPLFREIERGAVQLPPDDEVAGMYRYAVDFLEDRGIFRYEISNFSRPGYECRHNLQYWRYLPYLGIGAAAVSSMEGRRWKNISSIRAYQEAVFTGEPVKEEEENLSLEEQQMEMIMLALRLREGLNMREFKARFGIDCEDIFMENLHELQRNGLIKKRGDYISVTASGWLLMNEILVRLCGKLLDKITET